MGEDSKDKENGEQEEEDKSVVKSSKDDDKEVEKTLSEDTPEVFKDLPPDVQRTFERTFMGMMRVGGQSSNPLLDKFEPEHIGKYLDYMHADDENEFKLKTSNRVYSLVSSQLCNVG